MDNLLNQSRLSEQLYVLWRLILQLGMWLLIPGIFLVISLWYQAETPARELAAQASVRETREISERGEQSLLLIIDYPGRLLLNPDEKMGIPLGIALLELTPIPTPSSVSISGTTTAQLTQSSLAMPTPSPVPSATPSPVVVQLLPTGEGLAFSNKEGQFVIPLIALTPAKFAVTPATLYLRPIVPSVGNPPTEVIVGIVVSDPSRSTNIISSEISIEIESKRIARWRHFLELTLGTPVAVGALIGTMVVFGLQQWSKWKDVQQDRVQKKREQAEEHWTLEQERALEQRRYHIRKRIRHEMKSTTKGRSDQQKRDFDKEIDAGLQFLGIRCNPFAAEFVYDNSIEIDTNYFFMSNSAQLHRAKPVVVCNIPSAEHQKVAALMLIRHSFRMKDAFPVYWPVSTELQVEDVAEAVAWTLLHYFAVNPNAYNLAEESIRVKQTYILALFYGQTQDILFQLKGAGPKDTLDNRIEMRRRIKEALEGITVNRSLGEEEYLYWLENIHPEDFHNTVLILDLLTISPATQKQRRFVSPDLIHVLADADIFTKIFTEKDCNDLLAFEDAHIIMLRWDWTIALENYPSLLAYILHSELGQCGEDSLASWCDPVARRLDPDDRLVAASGGTPAGLIRKGNELLRWIGKNQAKLSARSLDDILGPLSSKTQDA